MDDRSALRPGPAQGPRPPRRRRVIKDLRGRARVKAAARTARLGRCNAPETGAGHRCTVRVGTTPLTESGVSSQSARMGRALLGGPGRAAASRRRGWGTGRVQGVCSAGSGSPWGALPDQGADQRHASRCAKRAVGPQQATRPQVLLDPMDLPNQVRWQAGSRLQRNPHAPGVDRRPPGLAATPAPRGSSGLVSFRIADR